VGQSKGSYAYRANCLAKPKVDDPAAMKTLIVDHEPSVRETLRMLCEANDGIEEVTMAESGATAINMIRARRPDLLLLDVELSDMTGFDVLRSLGNAARPQIIMVSESEDHAVEALDVGAIDCLRKPISAKRFATAIEKVNERCASTLTTMQQEIAANRPSHFDAQVRRRHLPMHLMAEFAHRLYFLPLEDVDYIESCGNYVLIHVGEQKFVRRDTLKRLASALHEVGFECIHRSTLVNLARVAFAEKLGRGALAFTLTNGTRLLSKVNMSIEFARAQRGEEPRGVKARANSRGAPARRLQKHRLQPV
jgi:two-component system, LytTR family, response regulator